MNYSLQTTPSCDSDSPFLISQFIYFYFIAMFFSYNKNVSAHKSLRNIMSATLKDIY